MSGSDGTSAVLGMATTTTGIVVLPNTGSNPVLEIAIYVMTICGTLLLTSFVVTRVLRRVASKSNK